MQLCAPSCCVWVFGFKPRSVHKTKAVCVCVRKYEQIKLFCTDLLLVCCFLKQNVALKPHLKVAMCIMSECSLAK